VIENFAIVENSILMAKSSVSNHGKLIHSILGEFSGVSSGECVSSLVGPLVGFHHQALLIAAHWPEGKGNVGYGANIGSNHTGKSADQEIRPGEGCFYGLGCVVKFPVNLESAPYTLIASGVTLLPQTITFPFSLINSPAETVSKLSPSLNEIFPGWILSDSIFTILRNEKKFRARQGENPSIEWKVFRADIFRLVVAARDHLAAVDPTTSHLKTSQGETVYTDAHIRGLGKNYMREAARKTAVKVYSDFIRWFSLRCLWDKIKSDGAQRVLADLREKGLPGSDDWSFARHLIHPENPDRLLNEFLDLHDRLIVQGCIKGKERDNKRAATVIGESYERMHPVASEVEEGWRW
jgi:hypothetical protein